MELRAVEAAMGAHNGMQGLLHLNMWSLGLAVVLSVWWWVWVHRFMQRHYIGPKTWPLLGCVVEQARNFDILHDWLLEYFRRGILTFPVPMIAVNNTFTADPLNVEHILKTNFANYPKGELLRERFQDMLGSGIFNVDGEMWRHQRKVATAEFASSKLREYSIHAYRADALKLTRVLAMSAKCGQVIDMQDCFMRLTLDSICKLAFGVDVGSLSPLLPSLPFANAFDEANRLIVRRYIDLFWKLKRTLNVGAEGRLRQCINEVNSFLYKVIEARREEMKTSAKLDTNESQVDILSRFMSLGQGDDTYSDERLRDIVLNFIIAGRDTTAITLSWFFYELCRNPDVVDKILAEVSAVVGQPDETRATSTPISNMISTIPGGIEASCLKDLRADFGDPILEFAQQLTYPTLNKMNYLQAALTEALRLYPAVPLETKLAVEDDTFPDGTRIKQGEFVSYASYAMGRLKCIWGPDALEFKPERWLKDGIFHPTSPFRMTAFQAGPRMCLGKDSAYLQMKMTAVLLLRFFRFQLVDERFHPRYNMMIVLSIANGLPIHVSRR